MIVHIRRSRNLDATIIWSVSVPFPVYATHRNTQQHRPLSPGLPCLLDLATIHRHPTKYSSLEVPVCVLTLSKYVYWDFKNSSCSLWKPR